MLIILMTILAVCVASPSCAVETDPDLSFLNSWVEKGLWLPFKPALPNNFVLKPTVPNGSFGMADGVMWGTKENIEKIWNQKEPNAELQLSDSLIKARFSLEMQQTEVGELPIDESRIRQEFKKLGASEIHFERLNWGDYPVCAVEIRFPNKTPTAIAWVGLNLGPVIVINYLFSDNSSMHDKEWIIWDNFLHKTIAISAEEYAKNLSDFQQLLEQQAQQMNHR